MAMASTRVFAAILWAHVTSATACEDMAGWQDSQNNTCGTYRTSQLCLSDGSPGPYWPADLALSVVAVNGVDATQACCVCGGGGGNATQECEDMADWQDRMGLSCANYTNNLFCLADGSPGPYWPSNLGNISDWAVNGVDATSACCACGGNSTRGHATQTRYQECEDMAGWQDGMGLSCTNYTNGMCRADGSPGVYWPSNLGNISDWAVNGVDATHACCFCGGGISTRGHPTRGNSTPDHPTRGNSTPDHPTRGNSTPGNSTQEVVRATVEVKATLTNASGAAAQMAAESMMAAVNASLPEGAEVVAKFVTTMNPVLDLTLEQATQLMTQTLGDVGDVTVALAPERRLGDDGGRAALRRLAPRNFVVTISSPAEPSVQDAVLAVDATALAEAQTSLFPNAAAPTMPPPVVEVVVVVTQEATTAASEDLQGLASALPNATAIQSALSATGIEAAVDVGELMREARSSPTQPDSSTAEPDSSATEPGSSTTDASNDGHPQTMDSSKAPGTFQVSGIMLAVVIVSNLGSPM